MTHNHIMMTLCSFIFNDYNFTTAAALSLSLFSVVCECELCDSDDDDDEFQTKSSSFSIIYYFTSIRLSFFVSLSLSLTLKTTKSCIAYTSLSSRSFPSIFHRNTRTSPKAISRKNKNNQNQRKECMQTGCKQSTQKSFVRIYSVNLE